MVTLPSSEPEPADQSPHLARQVAESFGIDAARYDRTRPSYPAAMIDRILAAAPGQDILDVGCGTGIAARQFRDAGCTVLGVEPDARMADFARETGIDVEIGTFENWDPAGRTFDAVIAGTAWHWVDPVLGTARAVQVLRPGGRFAAFWPVVQLPPDAAQAFATVYRRHLPDTPVARIADRPALEVYQPMLDLVAKGIHDSGAFTVPEQWRFDWHHTYTRDEWLDQIPTHGTLTQTPSDTLAAVLDGIGAAIDALGGTFTASYATVVITASVQPG
ncbi:class I SAM-dependent methyltransferase [Nocardia niigatensis]|uniref:class I SAM-dependent methyltransferase n=1 Tax=Nocardia niigatensis TaxID=209249 RepID=UPI000A03F1E3|nr:class I SAM-dependent methyltransferase [Nocardia niigatensis]